jgi:C4-dicarboxylate-specific signal transduction histidine kinase
VHFLQSVFASYELILAKYRLLADAVATSPEHSEIVKEIRAAEEQEDTPYLQEQAPKSAQRTLDGIKRVARIVGAMKEFAHRAGHEQAPSDINRALESTLIVAASELRCADVETHFENLPAVVCHLDDLNQVFLNLLVNAAHAIADRAPETGKGKSWSRPASRAARSW